MNKRRHAQSKGQLGPKTKEQYLKDFAKETKNSRYQNAVNIAAAAAISFPDDWRFPYSQAVAKISILEMGVDGISAAALSDEQQKELDEVVALCDITIEILQRAGKEDSKPYALLGNISRIREDYAESESHYLYGLSLFKEGADLKSLDLLSGYGWVLKELNKNQEAETYFQRAYELDNSHTDSALGYGMMLFLRKEFTLALKVFNTCLIYNPTDMDLLAGRNRILNGQVPAGLKLN